MGLEWGEEPSIVIEEQWEEQHQRAGLASGRVGYGMGHCLTKSLLLPPFLTFVRNWIVTGSDSVQAG